MKLSRIIVGTVFLSTLLLPFGATQAQDVNPSPSDTDLSAAGEESLCADSPLVCDQARVQKNTSAQPLDDLGNNKYLGLYLGSFYLTSGTPTNSLSEISILTSHQWQDAVTLAGEIEPLNTSGGTTGSTAIIVPCIGMSVDLQTCADFLAYATAPGSGFATNVTISNQAVPGEELPDWTIPIPTVRNIQGVWPPACDPSLTTPSTFCSSAILCNDDYASYNDDPDGITQKCSSKTWPNNPYDRIAMNLAQSRTVFTNQQVQAVIGGFANDHSHAWTSGTTRGGVNCSGGGVVNASTSGPAPTVCAAWNGSKWTGLPKYAAPTSLSSTSNSFSVSSSDYGAINDIDAVNAEWELGNVMRALPLAFPNVKVYFETGRVYGGYVTSPFAPNGYPYDFETYLAEKYLIQAQMTQCSTTVRLLGVWTVGCNGPIDPIAGNLDYTTNSLSNPSSTPVAPIIVWAYTAATPTEAADSNIHDGTYWALGATCTPLGSSRCSEGAVGRGADGLYWCDGQGGTPCENNGGPRANESDFDSDLQHLNDLGTEANGIGGYKVAPLLFDFFKNSQLTCGWFMAAPVKGCTGAKR